MDESAVSDPIVMEALFRIERSLGEVHSGVQATQKALEKHVEDDGEVEERVRKLEATRDELRGKLKVWGLVATGASIVAGWAVEWFSGR